MAIVKCFWVKLSSEMESFTQSSYVKQRLLTHYRRCCFSIRTENIRKPKSFLIFSGGIEKQHQAVMGKHNEKNSRNYV